MQAAIFKSNQSQAVRLPKAVAFPDDVKKVSVVVIGKSRLLTPSECLWDDWFDEPALSDFPEREAVFQAEREQF
ncbi:MAG: type II toxin-antitoxin system VapB family antitoxin [Neisseria sp.]|nr:type II toxin-antitoxin system VapB family antitoxin [Neisseria sp.]